jgi:hypothetical protein
MPFGIDTFRAHLDLITAILPGGDFFAWNSNSRPLFAGRNFLGRSFLWGHGEATNALQHPSPDDLTQLTLNVPLIAPMQGPQPNRQNVTGPMGHVYGKVDADALCKRLEASIRSGEFALPQNKLTHVWLSIDPTTPLSPDYWAGWSDRVNQYPFLVLSGFPHLVQPFRAGINCRYATGVTGKLQPDEQVIDGYVTAWKNYGGSHTHVYALWANFDANLPLDWARFSGIEMPLLWRFSSGFRDNTGAVVSALFDVDATNTLAGMQRATDYMLRTNQWQPSLAGVVNLGFSSPPAVDAQADCLSNAQVPERERGEQCGRFTMRQGPVYAIGRYVRASAGLSFSAAEADAVSARAALALFTVFERGAGVAGVGAPTQEAYYDPDHNMGRNDGEIAFPYCADVLHQPAQTHIFFAIDWTPPNENSDARKPWIQGYVRGIKDAYETYLATHPNRPYLIGIYGSGRVLRWCYEDGIASGFWQAGSMCQIESGPPRWPWPHATRWQYLVNPPFDIRICNIRGLDMDADWGDGGTWTLQSQVAQDLLAAEVRAARELLRRFFPAFANLLDRLR